MLYLAGVVVGEVQLGVLGGDSGQQEGPPLLAYAVMVERPVGGCCLHNNTPICLCCLDTPTMVQAIYQALLIRASLGSCF